MLSITNDVLNSAYSIGRDTLINSHQPGHILHYLASEISAFYIAHQIIRYAIFNRRPFLHQNKTRFLQIQTATKFGLSFIFSCYLYPSENTTYTNWFESLATPKYLIIVTGATGCILCANAIARHIILKEEQQLIARSRNHGRYLSLQLEGLQRATQTQFKSLSTPAA